MTALATITKTAIERRWKVSGAPADDLGIVRMRVEFPNGYEASIVRGPYTNGGSDGLFEGAVMRGGRLIYDTPVTDDVKGHMTEEEVFEFLAEVAALPPR